MKRQSALKTQARAARKDLTMIDTATENNTSIESGEMPELVRVRTRPAYTPKLTPEELEKGINQLPPNLYESIKDRIDKLPLQLLEQLVTTRKLPRKMMIRYDIPFNRHQIRQMALEAMYQHLLLNKDIRKCLFDVMEGANKADSFLYSLTVEAADDADDFIQKLAPYLRSDWKWDRLSLVDQAILLISMEDLLVNDTPKAIVIDEAVNLAKEYSDDASPKLINGILDRL